MGEFDLKDSASDEFKLDNNNEDEEQPASLKNYDDIEVRRVKHEEPSLEAEYVPPTEEEVDQLLDENEIKKYPPDHVKKAEVEDDEEIF